MIISELHLEKVPALASNLGEMQDLVFRASFYSPAIDTEACPVVYTNEVMRRVSDINPSVGLELAWEDKEIPNLATAFNSLEVAKEQSIMMLLWCRPAEMHWRDQETLVGQARLSFKDLAQFDQDVLS